MDAPTIARRAAAIVDLRTCCRGVCKWVGRSWGWGAAKRKAMHQINVRSR